MLNFWTKSLKNCKLLKSSSSYRTALSSESGSYGLKVKTAHESRFVWFAARCTDSALSGESNESIFGSNRIAKASDNALQEFYLIHFFFFFLPSRRGEREVGGAAGWKGTRTVQWTTSCLERKRKQKYIRWTISDFLFLPLHLNKVGITRSLICLICAVGGKHRLDVCYTWTRKACFSPMCPGRGEWGRGRVGDVLVRIRLFLLLVRQL